MVFFLLVPFRSISFVINENIEHVLFELSREEQSETEELFQLGELIPASINLRCQFKWSAFMKALNICL